MKNNGLSQVIPIVFAFDENLILPAEVAICSLLENALPTTIYDIYILHGKNTDLSSFGAQRIKEQYSNCNITLRDVGDSFAGAYEIRGITNVTYYRLLIPSLIHEYEKILYSDVDVIFCKDLSEVYQLELTDNYLAATYDWGMMIDPTGQQYIASVEELSPDNYLQAGFLLMNSKKLRKDNMVERFKELAQRNYKFQDQDILNIACGHRMVRLPIYYNMTDYTFRFLNRQSESLRKWCGEEELRKASSPVMIHYNGHKPWKKYSVNFDIWWEYYRKSPFFDSNFYFDFFYNRLNEYDLLSLWKRVKILIRYFVYGRKEN